MVFTQTINDSNIATVYSEKKFISRNGKLIHVYGEITAKKKSIKIRFPCALIHLRSILGLHLPREIKFPSLALFNSV